MAPGLAGALTRHARERMRQRGIRGEALEALLEYGRTEHLHERGMALVYFDKPARAALVRAHPEAAKALSRLRRTYAVLGGDGSVVTVGHRYRRIRRPD